MYENSNYKNVKDQTFSLARYPPPPALECTLDT